MYWHPWIDLSLMAGSPLDADHSSLNGSTTTLVVTDLFRGRSGAD